MKQVKTLKNIFSTVTIVSAIVATLAIGFPFTPSLQASMEKQNESPISPLMEKNTTPSSTSQMTFGEFMGGHDVTGDGQTWIILGYWKTNLFSLQYPTSAITTTSDHSSATISSSGGVQSVSAATTTNNNNKPVLINNNPSNPIFYANLTLLRLDGSMPKIYTIKDFTPLSMSTESTNGLTTILKGTGTIDTMAHSQITNVPMTITVTLPEKVDDHNIVANVFPDPSTVNYEFGKTPLFSLVRNYDTSVPSNLLNIPMC